MSVAPTCWNCVGAPQVNPGEGGWHLLWHLLSLLLSRSTVTTPVRHIPRCAQPKSRGGSFFSGMEKGIFKFKADQQGVNGGIRGHLNIQQAEKSVRTTRRERLVCIPRRFNKWCKREWGRTCIWVRGHQSHSNLSGSLRKHSVFNQYVSNGTSSAAKPLSPTPVILQFEAYDFYILSTTKVWIKGPCQWLKSSCCYTFVFSPAYQKG